MHSNNYIIYKTLNLLLSILSILALWINELNFHTISPKAFLDLLTILKNSYKQFLTGFTYDTGIAGQTEARVAVDSVNTLGAVQAWIARTLIYVCNEIVHTYLKT